MRGRLIALAFTLGLLGGCANMTTSTTIGEVQAESNAIVTALAAGAAIYTSAASTTPAQAAAVEEMLAVARSANAALQAKIDTASAAAATQSASRGIAALLSVLPIDPATKIAVDAGMAVLDTFVAEQTATPTPGAALALAAQAPTRVARAAPPIVIPMPRPHAPRVL